MARRENTVLDKGDTSLLDGVARGDRRPTRGGLPRGADPAEVPVGLDRPTRPLGAGARWDRLAKRWPGALGPTAGRSVLALVDQFVVSGTNFCTTVIVGRAAGADELGVYALAFALVALVVCAQESLILTPYTIYCHRDHGRGRARYAGSVLMHYAMLAGLVTICLVLGGAGMLAGTGSLRLAGLAWVLAAVVPFALLRDFVRRLAFAHLQIATALVLDLAVAVLQIGGLAGLAVGGGLRADTAYVVMGASCAVPAVAWFISARPGLVVRREQVFGDLRKNWGLGRWIFAALMALMLRLSMVPWLLALILGTRATGVFAACMSVVLFGNPVIQGISNVLGPRAALAFAEGGGIEVRRVVRRATLLLTLAMGLFCGVIILFGGEIIALLYGAEYADYQAIVTVLAIALLIRAVGMAAYNGLRAVERPDVNFKANLLGLATTVALCVWLLGTWGVVGAACGLVAGDLAGAAFRWAVFLRLVANTPREVTNTSTGG